MNLSRLLLVLAVACAVLTTASCTSPKDVGKVVVVFTDLSQSVHDREPYRGAWLRIVGSLSPGDRIVIATITDRTFSNFQPLIDREIPVFNAFGDNTLTFQQKEEATRRELSGAMDSVLAQERAQKTAIIDSVDMAAKIFHNDPRRPVLVLLSDMLEDSEFGDFEHIPVSEILAQQLAEKQRAHQELPDLLSAHVYVVGASARTARKAHEVERFWLEYVRSTHGQLLPQHYGPALIGFSES